MKAPTVYKMDLDVEVHHDKDCPLVTMDDKTWWSARPLNYAGLFRRLALAWGVFTGRYDALKWGGDQ